MEAGSAQMTAQVTTQGRQDQQSAPNISSMSHLLTWYDSPRDIQTSRFLVGQTSRQIDNKNNTTPEFWWPGSLSSGPSAGTTSLCQSPLSSRVVPPHWLPTELI